jgi:hypothetical protein
VSEAADLQQQLRRVEVLLRSLEACADAAAREAARELVRVLLNLHTAALAKLLELAGPGAAERWAADPLVGGLLLLHGLHPVPAEERVRSVLERERARFRALGGDVELLGATEEVVRLRLRGDPASGPALRSLAEGLLVEAAPDAAVEFAEAWDGGASGRVALPVVAAVPFVGRASGLPAG